jgi:hypothetical protein
VIIYILIMKSAAIPAEVMNGVKRDDLDRLCRGILLDTSASDWVPNLDLNSEDAATRQYTGL